MFKLVKDRAEAARYFKETEKYCRRCGKRLKLNSRRDLTRKLYCSHSCRSRYLIENGHEPLIKALRMGQKSAKTKSQGRKAPVLASKSCVKCFNQYEPTTARQLWCRNCCPDKQARTRVQRYGLSESEYREMALKQGNSCAICRKGEVQLYVDHNHSCCPQGKTCGKCVRGLLCTRCNGVLHVFESGLSSKFISYLQEHADAVS